MQSAESPSLNEAYNESAVAPHDGHDSFDDIRMTPEDSGYDERLRRSRSGAWHRGPNVENNRPLRKRPSIGRRMARATARFVVIVLIGVGATLAWQAYGDQARAMLATMDPSLAWLAPLPAAPPSPAAAAISAADLAQLIKPLAADIAGVRHDLEQLAAKQDQLAANQGQVMQGLSTLAAVEREIGVKISAVAAPKPVHPQPHRPAQVQPHEPTQLQPHEAAQRPAQPPEVSERR